jgi:hypothetical protein
MLYEKIQLEPDEEVLTVVRKHWFIIAAELFGTFMLALLPFFILVVFVFLPEQWNVLDLHPERYLAVITYAISGWLALCLMIAYATWTHYYLDLWVITDRRIIVIDQVTFFNRNVSIFRLERLQDIEYYIKGLLPTFLNYGTIRAQTASSFESNFETRGLPDPRGLQATIQRAMDARLKELGGQPIGTD